MPSANNRSKAKNTRSIGLAVGNRRLQGGKIRRALGIERDDLAVDQHVGQRAAFPGDRLELVGPVQPLARLQRGLAVLDAQLHAIAVELDLVAPARAAGRPLDGRAELRRDEVGHRADLLGFGQHRFALRARFRGFAPVGMPDRIGLAAPALRGHERFWRTALAGGDFFHRAARGDGAILVENIVGLAFFGELVAVLDQQPVGALAAAAVVAHAHQHPTAVQLLAIQRELQVALLEAGLGSVGFPVAAVPQLHRAAAILSLGNGAFEIAVIERMILDFHREPLVVRIERGPAGDRPGFEHAVEFEPEIVVQPGRGVLLDHEATPLRGRDLDFARRLRGLLEVPLLPIDGEVTQRHDQFPRQYRCRFAPRQRPGTKTPKRS